MSKRYLFPVAIAAIVVACSGCGRNGQAKKDPDVVLEGNSGHRPIVTNIAKVMHEGKPHLRVTVNTEYLPRGVPVDRIDVDVWDDSFPVANPAVNVYPEKRQWTTEGVEFDDSTKELEDFDPNATQNQADLKVYFLWNDPGATVNVYARAIAKKAGQNQPPSAYVHDTPNPTPIPSESPKPSSG